MEDIIKFAICADVHHDLAPYAKEKMAQFVSCAEKENADFIINLGDLCFPHECNNDFYALWQAFYGPRYHVLGNHDLDHNTKEQAIDYFGMPGAYYSFDCKGFHFIVLDPNNLALSDGLEGYRFGNYFAHPDKINWLGDTQLNWLRDDLETTDKKTVIFSHQSLENDKVGAKDADKLHGIISGAVDKNGHKKVCACLNGHDHVDGAHLLDNVHFVTINSMSFFYMNSQINIPRYSKIITEHYPILREAVPYTRGLYTVISITNEYLEISGSKSDFVGPSPLESGHCGYAGGFASTAEILPRRLFFT